MLFGSDFLDIVIGLIMVYLLLSLLVSSLNELIMSVFTSKRGEVLHTAIRTMLSDNFDAGNSTKKQQKLDEQNKTTQTGSADLGIKFYQHPLIQKFAKTKPQKGSSASLNRPSYLNKANFSKILLDILDDPNTINRNFNDVAERIKQEVPEGPTRTALLTFVKEAQGDVTKLDQLLQQWYDDMMQRASGWYKRHVQKVLLVLGLVISVLIDADTFSIADKLANDPEARQQMVNLADSYIESQSNIDTEANKENSISPVLKDSASNAVSQTLTKAGPEKLSPRTQSRIDSIRGVVHELVTDELFEARSILGMGWDVPQYQHFIAKKKSEKISFKERITTLWNYMVLSLKTIASQVSIQKIIGWLVTALAITLGAPFWFDMLKKVVNIRNTGSKPEDTPAKQNT